jgi:hypothetical protein
MKIFSFLLSQTVKIRRYLGDMVDSLRCLASLPALHPRRKIFHGQNRANSSGPNRSSPIARWLHSSRRTGSLAAHPSGKRRDQDCHATVLTPIFALLCCPSNSPSHHFCLFFSFRSLGLQSLAQGPTLSVPARQANLIWGSFLFLPFANIPFSS